MNLVNEVRIGNYLYGFDPLQSNSSKKEYFQVSNIDIDNGGRINVWIVEGFSDESASDIEPIFLTPAILESLGFDKRNYLYENHWSLEDLSITIAEENGGYAIFASEGTIGEIFYYLHELQNICSSLFKKEITFFPYIHA